MDIVHLTNCNLVIDKPSDMADDQCQGLPVMTTRDEHGPWCTSFWKPTEEELKTLNEGGVVCLNVRADGRQHPVVSVGTASLTHHEG